LIWNPKRLFTRIDFLSDIWDTEYVAIGQIGFYGKKIHNFQIAISAIDVINTDDQRLWQIVVWTYTNRLEDMS